MKNKIIVLMIMPMLFLTLISAVPTIIKTTIHVELNNNTITVSNDGSPVVSDSISFINGTIVPYTKDIESMFIREIGNNTDMAILIEQLKFYNADCGTKQLLFENCSDEKRNLTSQLDICNMDKGYKEKYETSQSTITNLNNIVANKDKDLSNKTLLMVGAFILGAGGCYFFLKNRGDIIKRDKEERSSYSEMERA